MDIWKCLKLRVLKLFYDLANHILTEISLKAQRPNWCANNYLRTFPLFSSLYCASLFGIVGIVISLVG